MEYQTRRGTELTTVVLDGNLFSWQLMLTSHTNEQRTSSPAGIRMKQVGRRGRRVTESVGKMGGRRGLGLVDAQPCQIHNVM